MLTCIKLSIQTIIHTEEHKKQSRWNVLPGWTTEEPLTISAALQNTALLDLLLHSQVICPSLSGDLIPTSTKLWQSHCTSVSWWKWILKARDWYGIHRPPDLKKKKKNIKTLGYLHTFTCDIYASIWHNCFTFSARYTFKNVLRREHGYGYEGRFICHRRSLLKQRSVFDSLRWTCYKGLIQVIEV